MALPEVVTANLPSKRMPAWAMAAGVAALLFGVVGYAKTEGYWRTDVPHYVYLRLVPHANEASHPMPGDPVLNQ
jgi:hypothetical protein